MLIETKSAEYQLALCDRIASVAHDGQTRKFGEDKGKPYKIHPDRVADSLSSPTDKAIAKIHDVVEDCEGWTFDRLRAEGVDSYIVCAVEYLTKRDSENYLDFILRAKKNSYARRVKMADIRDNMRDLKEGSLRDKYRMALYILEN